MYTEAKKAVSDLSESADCSKKLYKKAIKRSPRMRKEISISSKYFSSRSNKYPCAESLIKLDIDCNLLKFFIILFVGMLVMSLICSAKYKKR